MKKHMLHTLMVLVALAAIGAVAGIVTFYGGFYNVAAVVPHFEFAYKFLEVGMRESVKTHAGNIETPSLDDRAHVLQGLALYQQHCTKCHGAPGAAPEPFALGMVPAPANLAHTSRSWKPREIFWVIKNGIKMSGMPAWEFRLTDDQMWAITAFTTRLHRLSPPEFEALAREAPALPPALPAAAQAAVHQNDASSATDLERAKRPQAAALDRDRPLAGAGLSPELAGDPKRGRVAIYQYACTTCHHIPGTGRSGVASVGPPLERMATRAIIAGVLPNTPENMIRWLRMPREVDPRNAMPNLGLTEQDARDIAAYLYTLR